MTGRVIIVTGASSGIGFETARYLCEGGNDVVLACRDEQNGAEAVQRIKRLHPNSLVQCMQLDVSSLSSVRDFAAEFAHRKRRLSVLINNAATCPRFRDRTRRTTADGYEVTMATNHLGPFLLTQLLSDYLVQTAAVLGEARVVNVTCGLHDHENEWTARGLDFLDPENFQLQKEGTYTGLQAYKNSKLCTVLHAYELAERLRQDKVFVNAVDPGVVPGTQLLRHAGALQRGALTCCVAGVVGRVKHRTKSVAHAAAAVADVATSEKFEGRTGKYFRFGLEERSSVESYDRDLQRDVWVRSARLTHSRSLASGDGDDLSLS